MATDRRRRAAATATVGAGATFGGGVLRHKGVRAANEGEAPPFKWGHPIRTHQTRALFRPGARGRIRYVSGATMGLIGAPALAVGAHEYVTHRKRDDHRGFLSEGISGTQDALAQRAEGLKETPPSAKAGPFVVGAAAGGAGSQAAHMTLNRVRRFQGGRNHALRAGITALAGAGAAAASLPVSRHAVRGEYEVTPAGVRRRKRAAVRPSSKATRAQPRQRSLTSDLSKTDLALPAIRRHTRSEYAVRQKRQRGRFAKVDPQQAHNLAVSFARKGKLVEQKRALELRNRLVGKADYLGRHVSPHEQRAKTMAAGAIPGIPFAGPAAAAHMAGHYAPPGEKRKAEARQLGSSVATTATGIGGAYAATSNRRAGEQALRLHHSLQRAGEKISGPVRRRMPKSNLRAPGGAQIARAKQRGRQHAERTLARSSTLRRAVAPLARNKPAAVAGYIAGAKLTGTAYQSVAISRNQAAQRRYNLKHPAAVKKADATGMNRREQQKLIERKRRSAATQVVTGTLGLAGAGMGAALLPGVRGRLHPKHVQTLERAAIGTGLAAGGISGVHSIRSARLQRHELDAQERALAKADRPPLTRMREDQAHGLVQRYGTHGELPKTLSRQERMDAYAARYVHAGGHKGEHWQRRADRADKVKVGGLAGATAAGAGILALRHPRIVRALGHRAERAKQAVDSTAIGAATVSGAAELYAGHARRRRSSYSNSKAGVAASALRRMQDYSG